MRRSKEGKKMTKKTDKISTFAKKNLVEETEEDKNKGFQPTFYMTNDNIMGLRIKSKTLDNKLRRKYKTDAEPKLDKPVQQSTFYVKYLQSAIQLLSDLEEETVKLLVGNNYPIVLMSESIDILIAPRIENE